jgi:hypothetical protein
VNGLDVPGPARGLTQRLADLVDRCSEGAVADHRLGPQRAEELVLGDQAVAVRHEISQQGKGFRRELERLLAPPDPLVRRVQA